MVFEKLEENDHPREARSEKSEVESKSSLRIQYEAQVSTIQNQIGDLELIRVQFGLSQRKMAQLLLVDPSSWNRWSKDPNTAPPLLWRALQWYLALNDKIPGLNHSYFLSQNTNSLVNKTLQNLEKKQNESSQIEEEFRREIKFLQLENNQKTNLIQGLERKLIRSLWVIGCLIAMVLGSAVWAFLN